MCSINYRIKSILLKTLFSISILCSVFNINYTLAEDFLLEFTGKAETKGFSFSDNSSYKLYTSEGYWKSSFGDYGKNSCFGDITKNSLEAINLELICQLQSKDGSIAWQKVTRNSESQKAGVGQVIFFDGTKRLTNLVGVTCTHAVTYVEDAYFVMQKCKAPDSVLEVLKKFNN